MAMIAQVLGSLGKQQGQREGGAIQLPGVAPFNPQPMQTGDDTDPMIRALRQSGGGY